MMKYKYEDDVHRPFIETQQVDTGSKKCCHSACVLAAVAIVLFILGVILAVGGPIFFKLGLPKILREEIKKQVIIDSPSAEGYNDWLVDQDDQVPVYYGYYLYNLTNGDDVVNSHANPIYKQLGPYIYRRYKHKVNVEFMDDGNLVGYYSNRLYVFQPDMSNGSNADLITNVNPAYVGTVVVAGGDVNVIVGLSSPALAQMMTALTDPFLNMMISWNGANTLQTTFNNMMTGIASNFNNNTQQTLAFFCKSWANTTVQPEYYPEWFGMQLARGGVPTNISLQACARLFNASFTHSLVNTQEHASTTWMKATYDANALQTLQTAFPDLTAAQLNQVVWWRNNTFVQTVALPQLLARFGLTDPQDLILQQWGTGGVIPNNVQAFFPEWSFGMSPEFWLLSTTTMDVPSAKNVIFGPYAITVSLNMALLADPNTPGSLWGISNAQKTNLFNYMGGVAQTLSQGMITQVFSEGGGIITTKSVEEWLWNGTDPLLELLTPNDPYMAVQGPNNQTEGQTIIYTGKNDTDLINQYVQWRNQTSLDIWAKEYPVIGYTETGQFAPFMDENEGNYTHLHPFDNNLVRTLDLYKNSTTSLYGVDLWRYLLNETCFLPDPLFFQTIAGMANLTSFEKGAPIFLSLWDFVLVDPKYTAKVTGVYPNTTDPTNIVDVEPTTGITMSTVMKLQVNVYIPPNNNLFMFAFSNVTDDTFYPIVKIYRKTEITEHLANQFKDKVYLVQKLEVILFWVTLAVGITLVAGCAVMLAIRHIRKRSHSIN